MIRRNIQGVLVGSALAIVTTALYPVIKDTLRPLAYDLRRQMKYLAVSTKESIEDIVAEVKFERMGNSLDKDMYQSFTKMNEALKQRVEQMAI